MIDYTDLFEAATVEDAPAVAKILSKLTTDDLQWLRRDLELIQVLSSRELRHRVSPI